ncbi:hypothetical protein HPB51_013526 [Rhipicephalus microplus]|uniref:Uncharacterized protein n=1 Tax=Rhipicephalus microplus TaxID=6941 RepID=A0A9J6EAM2_RHIMP|nr:hypothetical protein HPB51_013526 [Rhipicephalus microplus]
MIMRDAVVEGSGNFDHLGFFNVHPNLSTRAYNISAYIENAASRSRDSILLPAGGPPGPKNQAPSRHRRARPCDASRRTLLNIGQHGGSSTRHGHYPSQYDPRNWTQVLRAQANLRETRNASHGTNANPSVRETPSQSRETPQTATTPGLQSSSTQLRVLHTTAQKIKELPPLPSDGFKVVFRSQAGLDLTTLQPRYLLTALMQAACADRPICADPPDLPCQ